MLVVVICLTLPPTIPFCLLSAVLYWQQVKLVDKAQRPMKKAANDAVAPIITNLNETLAGRQLIRTMGCEAFFLRRHHCATNNFTRSDYTSNSVINWGTIVAGFIGIVLSLAAAAFAVLMREDYNEQRLALALTCKYLLWFCLMLRNSRGVPGLYCHLYVSAVQLTPPVAFVVDCFIVPMYASFIGQVCNMVAMFYQSLERLLEYLRIPQEAARDSASLEQQQLVGHRIVDGSSWPSTGAISFEEASLRYKPSLPRALCAVNLRVDGGEHIGVVGRTGAGKSSLLALLFRLVEPSGGRVCIDGVDIASLGLKQLRSAIGIVPQDPILFRGTVRSNIDPFGHYTAEAAVDALRHVRMDATQLEAQVTKGGDNFSAGERQALALARAVLHSHRRIIAMDEPTANIDAKTDALLQTMLRQIFEGRTLLCIAHRLQTVIGMDRCDLPINSDSHLAAGLDIGNLLATCCDAGLLRAGLPSYQKGALQSSIGRIRYCKLAAPCSLRWWTRPVQMLPLTYARLLPPTPLVTSLAIP